MDDQTKAAMQDEIDGLAARIRKIETKGAHTDNSTVEKLRDRIAHIEAQMGGGPGKGKREKRPAAADTETREG